MINSLQVNFLKVQNFPHKEAVKKHAVEKFQVLIDRAGEFDGSTRDDIKLYTRPIWLFLSDYPALFLNIIDDFHL